MSKALFRRRKLAIAGVALATLAVASFVGYDVHWLQQRRTFAAGSCQLGATCDAPLLLRPFSETGYSWIHVRIPPLPHRPTTAELEQRQTAERLFPEAQVGWIAISP